MRSSTPWALRYIYIYLGKSLVNTLDLNREANLPGTPFSALAGG